MLFMLRSDLARLSLKALAVITLRVVIVRGASFARRGAMTAVQMRKMRVRIAIQGDNRQFKAPTVPFEGTVLGWAGKIKWCGRSHTANG